MKYGKLTKDQAKSIGNFIDKEGVMFTPFCQEMTDETYLISQESWDKYNQRLELKGISEPKWYEFKELEFKELK